VPEVTFIPTTGDKAAIGATMFLAALAFPDSTADRDKFMRAVHSSIRRGRENKSLLRDDGRRITKALQRIAEHRVPAGAAALNLCFGTGHRIGPFVLKNKYKGVTKFAYENAEKFRRHADPNNFLPQVWKPSFRVLHMAMAFNLKALKQLNRDQPLGVLPSLLLDTSWLLPALRISANHLLQMPSWLQHFDQDAAVLLLPEEPDPTLDLYKQWVRGELEFKPFSNVT
jgi:hypothetical protein